MRINLFGFKNNLLASVYFSDIYEPLRDYYLSSGASQKEDEEIDGNSCNSAVEQQDAREKFGLLQFNSDFPPLSLRYRFLNRIEVLMNVLQITNTLILDVIHSGWFGSDGQLQCYLVGRLAGFPPSIGKFATLLASTLHLSWKTKTRIFEKSYRLDVVLFLQRNQESIDKHVGHACLKKGSYLVGDKISCDDYLRDVLYIKFKDRHNHRIEYILRPNRTPENRAKLAALTERMGVINVFNILGITLFLLLIVIWGSIFDMSYIKNYPECTPQLDQLGRENKLDYFSVHLYLPSYKHRLITAFTDFFYSLFLVFEASVTTFSPTALMVILCEDLMIYWRAIDKELTRLVLHAILPDHYTKASNNGRSGIYRYDAEKDAYYTNAALEQTNRYLLLKKQDGHFVYVSSDKKMDIQVQVVQRLIIDFFLQLKYYDRFVSMGITAGLFAWLAIFVHTSYVVFYKDDFSTLLTLNSLRVGGVGLVVSPLIVLVRLKRLTSTGYTKINTLMAHEKVNRRKLIWLQILEFYNNKSNHYGFTLMHSYHVDWKLLLQLFGSSVSFIIVLETFKKYN